MFYRGSGAIRWDLLTHLVWINSSVIDTNGAFIAPTGSNLTALLDTCNAGHQNKKKVIYGISGGMESYTNMMMNATLRTAYANAVAGFVLTNNFDGVDFDIEYPNVSSEQVAMGSFFTAMRSALGRQPLLTADTSYWTVQIPVSVINSQLDWVQIMDYYHMAAAPSQFSFAQASLDRYLSAGVFPGKLVLGVGLAGQSPSGGYDVGYKSLVSYIVPYNTAQDIVTNGSGTVYYLNGNRDTQRAKVDLAATNANGTMCWHLTADTTSTTTSLAVAIQAERTNFVAPIDGFEYPANARLDSLYTPGSTCLLSTTNERVAGDWALDATMTYSGAQWSGGSFYGPVLTNGWSFPTNALLRLDLNVLNIITNGTFYLTLYDGDGRAASYYKSILLKTTGWRRLLLSRSEFQDVATGFRWDDIRKYRFLTQISTASPNARTGRLLLDNFSLINPDSAGRPAQTDIGIAPVITAQPTNQTAYFGGPVTLRVAASGTDRLGYQWRKDDADIGLATNATYYIANATTNTAGNYSVSVFNAFGLTNSAMAAILVTSPPPPVISSATLQPGTGFLLGGAGLPLRPYVLMTTSNVAPPVAWAPLATNFSGSNGLFQFTDTQTSNIPRRFYRVRTP